MTAYMQTHSTKWVGLKVGCLSVVSFFVWTNTYVEKKKNNMICIVQRSWHADKMIIWAIFRRIQEYFVSYISVIVNELQSGGLNRTLI